MAAAAQPSPHDMALRLRDLQSMIPGLLSMIPSRLSTRSVMHARMFNYMEDVLPALQNHLRIGIPVTDEDKFKLLLATWKAGGEPVLVQKANRLAAANGRFGEVSAIRLRSHEITAVDDRDDDEEAEEGEHGAEEDDNANEGEDVDADDDAAEALTNEAGAAEDDDEATNVDEDEHAGGTQTDRTAGAHTAAASNAKDEVSEEDEDKVMAKLADPRTPLLTRFECRIYRDRLVYTYGSTKFSSRRVMHFNRALQVAGTLLPYGIIDAVALDYLNRHGQLRVDGHQSSRDFAADCINQTVNRIVRTLSDGEKEILARDRKLCYDMCAGLVRKFRDDIWADVRYLSNFSRQHEEWTTERLRGFHNLSPVYLAAQAEEDMVQAIVRVVLQQQTAIYEDWVDFLRLLMAGVE